MRRSTQIEALHLPAFLWNETPLKPLVLFFPIVAFRAFSVFVAGRRFAIRLSARSPLM